MSLRRISTIILGTIGITSVIFAIWVFNYVPYTSFAALMLGIGGLAIIAIAVLVYRSTSFLEVIRAIVSWLLILAGIPQIVIFLWAMLMGSAPEMIIQFGILGLTSGTLGWTLLKPKFLISIARRMITGFCLTSGAGSVLFPIWILSIYGTNIAFTGIATYYLIAGVALIAIGSRLRRPTKTKEN